MHTDEIMVTEHVTEPGTLAIRWPEPDGEQILMCVMAEIETFAELNRHVATNIEEPSISGMLHRGVSYRPSVWFGNLSGARSKAISRATMRLERDGFARRIVEPRRNRVTHIRPTLAGMRYMTDVHQARPERIAAGLRRTRWGPALADELLKTVGTSAGQLSN